MRNFANSQAAAEFIASVAADPIAYAQYHKWRTQSILPKFRKILDYLQHANDYSLDSMMSAMAHSTNPQLRRYEILEDIGLVFSSY